MVTTDQCLASKNTTESMEWSTPDEDSLEKDALPRCKIRRSRRSIKRRVRSATKQSHHTLCKSRRPVAGDRETTVGHVVVETSQLEEARESVHGGEVASAVIQSGSFQNWRENIGVGHLVADREKQLNRSRHKERQNGATLKEDTSAEHRGKAGFDSAQDAEHFRWTRAAPSRWTHHAAGKIDVATLMEKKTLQARTYIAVRSSAMRWRISMRCQGTRRDG